MRSISARMFLVLVVTLVGCGTTGSLCRSAADEARRFPRIVDGAELVPGQIYYFVGFWYSEFEDSGLISIDMRSARVLEIFEDLKFRAFCYQWSPPCSRRMDNIERSRGKGIRIARVKALVKFIGLGGRGYPLSRNQCRLGSLQVESLISLRPVVDAPLPEDE